jgi:hypothetical protein
MTLAFRLSGSHGRKVTQGCMCAMAISMKKGCIVKTEADERGRYEDFQSSCRSGTMCPYRSLLVSIQAFNGGFRSLILPIRTHSVI